MRAELVAVLRRLWLVIQQTGSVTTWAGVLLVQAVPRCLLMLLGQGPRKPFVHQVATQGRWQPKPRGHKVSSVTQVNFGGGCETNLAAVAGPQPQPVAAKARAIRPGLSRLPTGQPPSSKLETDSVPCGSRQTQLPVTGSYDPGMGRIACVSHHGRPYLRPGRRSAMRAPRASVHSGNCHRGACAPQLCT